MEYSQQHDDRIRQRSTLFACLTGTLFVGIASLLVSLDAVPEVRVRASDDVTRAATSSKQATTTVRVDDALESHTPVRVTVRSVGIDTTVGNPSGNAVETLDRALLSGAVHYPGSAAAGEQGTMLIFGHSSHLPIVRNKAFQAFNGLEQVHAGDVVSVYTTTRRYDYRIDTIRLTTADAAVIELTGQTAQLVLSTCNTFGDKQERWVATATLFDATHAAS